MIANMPDFLYEKRLWKKGYSLIAGVDEVGRGCFAGPIVTGCVVFPRHPSPDSAFYIPDSIRIDDSKKMTPRQREKSAEWIKENALAWGIGEISVEKINRVGMAKAAKMCFRKAIANANKKLGFKIDFLLSDAFFISYVPGLPTKRRKNKKGRYYKSSKVDAKKVNGRQLAIINGDEKSSSIAAASIVAKVYRDELMEKLGNRSKYKKYGWTRNKGYGTREHLAAIKKYGTTRYHRKTWIKTWESKLN